MCADKLRGNDVTTTKGTHTAGPWHTEGEFVSAAHKARTGYQIIRGHMDVFVCKVFGEDDARLIAAAPEGYETACCTYLWMLITLPESIRLKAQAQLCSLRNYIAKADGRTQQEVQDHFESEAAIAKAEGGRTIKNGVLRHSADL